jgi:hypothetical protein
MTAYPSYNPNNNSGLDMLAGLIGQAPSSVATILGGVAVGIVGLGALGFAINYLRKGGTIKGLFDIAKSNAGAAKNFLDKAPLPDSLREKVKQAEAAAADPRAQAALQAVQDPHAAIQQAVNSVGLPPSLALNLSQILPPTLTPVPAPLPASTPLPASSVSIPVLQQLASADSAAPLAPQTATIEVSAEHIEAIKALLASKGTFTTGL